DKIELEADEVTGAAIVRRALEEPLKQIAVNAGLEGGVVVEKVKTLPPGEGLDADTGEYTDMFKAGIIDPAKVTRSALQNAASIAGLFLTTEAVIAEKPEKEKVPAAPAGGGDMDCCHRLVCGMGTPGGFPGAVLASGRARAARRPSRSCREGQRPGPPGSASGLCRHPGRAGPARPGRPAFPSVTPAPPAR